MSTGRELYAAKQRVLDALATMRSSQDEAVYGPRVIKMFTGVPRSVFIEIDNQGGNAALPEASQAQFWMVRRVRNSQEWGRKLFEVLT